MSARPQSHRSAERLAAGAARAAILVTVFACLAFCTVARADLLPAPAVIGLHLRSVHRDDGKGQDGAIGWNNRNLGAYARWSNGLTVGAFRNSLYRTSVYVGWTVSDDADRFALTLAAMSGYDKLTDGPGDHQAVRCDATHGCRTVNLKSVVLPVLVPSVRLGLTDRLSARISAIVPPGQPVAIHFSLEWRL